MAAELRSLNPRLQVEQIPNAGHGLPFEQPKRLSEVVLSFLRGMLAAERRPHGTGKAEGNGMQGLHESQAPIHVQPGPH
jgi:hypothetical protein